MKKLLAAALLSALAISFNACSDDDDTEECFDPTLVGMVNDYTALGTSVSTVGEQPAGVDWSAGEAALPAEAATYLTNCTNFVQKVDTAVNKYKKTTKDTLTSEWDRFKKTSTMCQINKGLITLLQGLTITSTTASIKEQMKTCGAVMVTAGKMSEEAATASVTSFEGWSNILQAAADYTGAQANKTSSSSSSASSN